MKIKDLFSKVKSALGIKKKTIPAPPVLTPSQPKIHIIVKANGKPIGAVQSVSVSESINDPVVQVNITHARFTREGLDEVFEKGALMGEKQILPLQIDIGSGNFDRGEGTLATSLYNLWIKGNPKYTYFSGEWVIVETLDMTTESIDKLNGDKTRP